ncbi:MAG: GDP-mannose 4,6-dehydratase [Candidatus Marinimicrobia bacterium]|nr:GDP-mannose 4,6-dehydratase [Candidatus Neomarinimicrobiota bacterium]
MDSILVTGCAGFIGYHLTISLLKDGIEVLGIDNLNEYYDINLKNNRLLNLKAYRNFTFQKIDIANKVSLSQRFKKFQPDMVVNLAAQAGVRYSIENPYAYLDSNLTGFLNILEMCRNYEVKGLIYASSSSVYGSNTKYPFNTSDRTDNPIALYGATKKANELMAHSYSHLYNLPTTGLRYFTVYGPWGRPDMAMYIFTENIFQGKSIPVFNQGNMKRDFTFIDDIISGTRSAMENNYACEIFNLGNNKSEKLMDMIKIIETNLAKKADIDFQPMKQGDVPESFADIDKSIEKLDYHPKIDIEDGIPLFIDWYKSYIRK